MNWIKHKLGDCAYLVRSSVQPDEVKDEKYIGLEHISQGNLALLGFGFANEVVSQKNRFSRGDILFGKLRPYFRKVIIAPFDGVCSTDIWVVRAKPGIDQRFLYYWMASKEFVEKVSQASEGTKMPRASWDFAAQIESNIPPLAEQRAIAEVLSALDDKIELNRRMNQTLEELAQALFKHWFVDNPEREGWEEKPIGDVLSIVGGSTPSTTTPMFWHNGKFYWATPKDLSSLSSPELLSTERKVTDTGLAKISSGLLPVGTVLLSSRAPVGYLAIAEIPVAINQGFIAIKPTPQINKYYILNWLQDNIEEIKGRANGTTFQEISKSNFRLMLMKIPSEPAMKQFEIYVEPIYSKIVCNLRESQTLAELRDTLLPKLMASKIQIRMGE